MKEKKKEWTVKKIVVTKGKKGQSIEEDFDTLERQQQKKLIETWNHVGMKAGGFQKRN